RPNLLRLWVIDDHISRRAIALLHLLFCRFRMPECKEQCEKNQCRIKKNVCLPDCPPGRPLLLIKRPPSFAQVVSYPRNKAQLYKTISDEDVAGPRSYCSQDSRYRTLNPDAALAELVTQPCLFELKPEEKT